MSDIQFAFENAKFPLTHFDAWVKISTALGHFWSSFSSDVMDVIRAVYAKSGWSGVRELVEPMAPLSGWGPSFSALGGIMPPTCVDHIHTTVTGRLEISVTEDGHVVTRVFRLISGARVEIASFQDHALTQQMPQKEWESLGGKDECFSTRHQEAVDEVLKYV